MADAMTIAASGMRAAERALSVVASDVAVAAMTAPIPATTPAQAPYANLRGMIAAPNLDMATLMVSQMEAANSFRANLAVYRTASRMYQSLLRL